VKLTSRHFFHYALAIVLVIVALLIRIAVEKMVGSGLPIFITYYPAIMFTALAGGLGPGLAATAAAIVMVDYFTITPHTFGQWNLITTAGIAIFSGMGFFISLVAHYYRQTRDNLTSQVEQRTAELNLTNAALKKKVEEYEKAVGEIEAAHRKTECSNIELETIFSAIQDAVLIYDTDMNVRKANQTFITKYGFDPTGLNVKDMITRTRCRNLDGTPVPVEIQPTPRALQGEKVSNQKFLITVEGGADEILETSSTPLFFDGSIGGIVTVWHDISELIHAQETIRRAKEEWESTFDSIPDLITILDDQHRILRINRAMADKVKLDPSHCVGLTCHSILHGTDSPLSFCPHTQSLQDCAEHETVVVDSNTGESFLVSTTPLFDSNARMYATVHVGVTPTFM